MSRSQENAIPTTPLVLYVSFVLLLLLGVLTFHSQIQTTSDSADKLSRVDSEDFVDESEIASRTMIG